MKTFKSRAYEVPTDIGVIIDNDLEVNADKTEEVVTTRLGFVRVR